jgi:hypothetical protein
MDARCLTIAQMEKGFYVKKLEDNTIKTLWVHEKGYSKKAHPSDLAAVEWLIERGCPLKEDVSAEVKAEAEMIRKGWLSLYGAPAPLSAEPAPEHGEAEVVVEAQPDDEHSDGEHYEPVVAPPVQQALDEAPQEPSGAPEVINLTHETTPEALTDTVRELERLIGHDAFVRLIEENAGSSPQSSAQS